MEMYEVSRELQKIANNLHHDIRNYSNMRDIDKPIVVSACLLTLKYIKDGVFELETLNGDTKVTDGEKVFNLIIRELKKTTLNKDIIKTMMNEYLCLKELKSINKIIEKGSITPLKAFIICIQNNLVLFCEKYNLNDDYLGIFYSEFMKYSEADGQSLGIILTPMFITDIITTIHPPKKEDIIFDPCCGTGGFLVSYINKFSDMGFDIKKICENQIYGCDIQPNMVTITMTNLILRGKETNHIKCTNFMELKPTKISTIISTNPPYAQGKKNDELYEIKFVKKGLDNLKEGGKYIGVVPASTFIDSKKTNGVKKDIYKHHTLEAVITLNQDTFWGVGTMPVIVIFTAHQPHPKEKVCKFIDFTDDGYESQPHVGRVYTNRVKERKEYLAKVYNDEIIANDNFCIYTTVKEDDEWLYNFYHTNLNIPSKSVFSKKVNDYMVFQMNMLLNGKTNIFEGEPLAGEFKEIHDLEKKEWGIFTLGETFTVKGAMQTRDTKLKEGNDVPRVTTSMFNNAFEGFYSNLDADLKKARINNGNVITIETATKGHTFYQPSAFIANAHVFQINTKDRILNQYSGLFLAACITSAIEKKYYYGYKFSLFRIMREKVLLPVTKDGEIDYEYMEQYIKNLFIRNGRIYQSYKNY